MGVGMPEYLLIFRKPPTETVNSYADLPVVKDKAAYSRSRWQIDAHGFARSSDNRLLTPDDLKGRTHAQIFRLFREHSMTNVYDFEEHVKLGEALARHMARDRSIALCRRPPGSVGEVLSPRRAARPLAARSPPNRPTLPPAYAGVDSPWTCAASWVSSRPPAGMVGKDEEKGKSLPALDCLREIPGRFTHFRPR